MSKIAQIIPFKKLPRGMDVFDYRVPDKFDKVIKLGSLVEIPFKQRKLDGIVYKFIKTSAFHSIRDLTDVKSTVEYLSEKQLLLAEWFTEHYFYSLASTVRMIAPQPPKKSALTKDKKLKIGCDKISISKQISALGEKLAGCRESNFMILANDQKLKTQLQLSLIKKIVHDKKQALFLFPQKNQVENFLKILPADLEKTIAVIGNELFSSKNRYYKTWKKIKTGDKQLIIGTRSAIFAPVSDLALIYIDNEDAEDYKNWDQNPRYNTIEIAKKIQLLTGCKLILSGSNPRIEDYFEASRNNWKLINLGKKQPIKIIDLIEERRREFTYLSNELIESLEKSTADNPALLIVNKKGSAGFLWCQDCHHVPACPKCRLPLAYAGKQLKCYHCQYEQATLLACPKCRGSNFKPLGIGIDGIKTELIKIFPDKKMSLDLNQKNIDIYLSTAQISDPEIWRKIAFCGLVYIDSLMYLPDFSANFKIYQLINKLRTDFEYFSTAAKPKILLQTCFINNPAIANLNNEYQKFFDAEIAARKTFNYPPFCTLIKLFFQDSDKTVCVRQAKDLHNELKKAFPTLEISQPYLYYREQIRGRFRAQILLKLNKNDHKALKQIIAFIPDFWMIDRNPLSVL
jgi:primosomal protein N' (replication factor Y) (superfamily II helicase)